MGCDIHEHVELLIDGQWIYAGNIILPRNYLLFSVLADVRNYDDAVPCVTGSYKGLPENIDPVLQQISDEYGGDGHSHSYLSIEELQEAKEIYEKHCESDRSWPEVLDKLEELRDKEGVEDVRFVFWFDN